MVIKNLLGSLSMMILGPVNSKNIDCLLIKHHQPNFFHVKISFVFLSIEVTFSTEKWRLQKARTFFNIFRFINELCILINDEFKNNFNDIYTHVMSLNSRMKMMILVKPRFWSFSIDVHDRKFTLSYLIKRHAFSYHRQCFVLRSVLKFYMLPGQ